MAQSLDARVDSLWYPVKTEPLTIAEDINFSVSAGEILGIIGPNGCGKSTLLRALSGIHTATRQNIKLDGQPLAPPHLTYISQNYRKCFFPWASLRRHIDLNLPKGQGSKSERYAQIDSIAETLGVEVNLSLRPGEASGGMLQQVNLVLALARQSPVMFADEPFSALDISTGRRLRQKFRQHVIDEQRTCILVLHDPAEILEICDKVLLIPDKPFSTEAGKSEFHTAELIQLPHREITENSAPQFPITFAKTMKRVLNVDA